MKKIIKFQLVLLLVFSCNSLKETKFDQYSLDKTIELKEKTIRIMSLSEQNYDLFISEIDNYKNDLKNHSNYESDKPGNIVTKNVWKIFLSSENDMIFVYLNLWKKKTKLPAVFIQESKKQILRVFDILIEYEKTKTKESENQLKKIIQTYGR